MIAQSAAPLLEVRELTIAYGTAHWRGLRRIPVEPTVHSVSLSVAPGETLGLVGESGSGKSSVARTIVGLNRARSGSILFDGVDLVSAPARELRRVRREIQMVFQDPFASLNPRMSVGEILTEPWRSNPGVVPRNRWRAELGTLMEQVGLDPDHATRYPAQFSGGQRQRICIARALALRPRLVICDEAVSALDVSIQAQILNLLKELQGQLGLAYLFISHDLGVVRHVSDRIAVMFRGRIVEQGDREQIYEHPRNEYTRELLSAEPSLRPWAEEGSAA